MDIRSASIACLLPFFVYPLARIPGLSPASFEAPNIVLVVLDDPNPRHLGVEGYPIPVSPSIDSFASKGFVFRNVQTNPRCAPSVTQLLSGRECLMTQICWNGNPDSTPVPEWLLPKVLRHGVEQLPGTEQYLTFGQGKGVEVDPENSPPVAFEYGRPDPSLWRDPSEPAWTEEMTAFMDVPDGGKPRFLWVMPTMPHVPWEPGLVAYQEDLKPDILAHAGQTIPPGVTDLQAFLEAEEQQLKMMRYTDQRLGEFLAAAKDRFKNDDRDTWLILVVGDNGFANGQIGKGSPYEAGVRAWVGFRPLTMPRNPARVYEMPISTLDVSQTVVRMGRVPAGVVPDGLYRGKSLFPLLLETQAPLIWAQGRDTVYTAVFPDTRTPTPDGIGAPPHQDVYALCGHHVDAAGQRWKYVLWQREVREGYSPIPPGGGGPLWLGTESVGVHHDYASFAPRPQLSEELYWLDSALDDGSNNDLDPFERVNVVEAEEYATLLAQLRCGAYEWWEQAGGGALDPRRPCP